MKSPNRKADYVHEYTSNPRIKTHFWLKEQISLCYFDGDPLTPSRWRLNDKFKVLEFMYDKHPLDPNKEEMWGQWDTDAKLLYNTLSDTVITKALEKAMWPGEQECPKEEVRKKGGDVTKNLSKRTRS